MIKIKLNEDDEKEVEEKLFVNEITVDCVVFGYVKGSLEVLLVKEQKFNNNSQWGLVSGCIKLKESTDQTAKRLLLDYDIGDIIFLRQLKAYCDTRRSPVNRIITICYYALINMEKYRVDHSNLSQSIRWCRIKNVPQLIHDQNAILDFSLMQLETLVKQSPVALCLLPEKFTLLELMNVYQNILGVETDKSNFRRKMLKKKLLMPLDEKEQNVSHRAAKLYKFDSTICEDFDCEIIKF